MDQRPDISILSGHNLVGITFIHNYVQILLEGDHESPFINGYVWPVVKRGEEIFTVDKSGYRDSLCAQIGKKIVHAVVDNEGIELIFLDGSEISFSLKEENKLGPEAVILHVGGTSYVW